MQQEGNKCFGNGDFHGALTCYYQAIEGTECDAPAAVWNNISLCNIRLGEYEAALQAADQAILLDPGNAKSRYRRATALMHLGKYAQAIDVLQTMPSKEDEAVQSLLQRCREGHIRAGFARAIQVDSVDHLWNQLNEQLLDSLDPVPELYTGPRLPDLAECLKDEQCYAISDQFIDQLVEYCNVGKVLPRRVFVQLLLLAVRRFSQHGSIVKVTLPTDTTLTVFGDVHGQWDDFLRALRMNGLHPSATNFLFFNGDIVDRGNKSLEILTVLLALKVRYPHYLFINRGNHEFEGVNEVYGFGTEVARKYDDKMFRLIARFLFPTLPIGHVINERVFVVHGGLPPHPVDLDKFNAEFDRLKLIKSCSPEELTTSQPGVDTAVHFLWSDPDSLLSNGYQPSHRGIGVRFSGQVTRAFLAHSSLAMLIRSHEWCKEGYRLDHDGRCITVFSAPNYTGNGQNDAAYIRLNSDCTVYQIYRYGSGDSESVLAHSGTIESMV